MLNITSKCFSTSNNTPRARWVLHGAKDFLKYFHTLFLNNILFLLVLQFRSSLFYNTSARHEWHERDTSNTCTTQTTRATWVRHECCTSTTGTTRVRHQWKILILITAQVKTYFHTSVLAIWQMKDYKERSNFILRTTFWKCLVPMPKCISKKRKLISDKNHFLWN